MVLRQRLRAVLCVAPALFYTVGIFTIGAIPVAPPIPGNLGDKWLHAAVFGLYVPVLLLADGFLRPEREFSRRIWLGAVASSAIGMALEIWQLLWPTRTFEVLDWAADTLGAAIGALVLFSVALAWTRVVPRRTGV